MKTVSVNDILTSNVNLFTFVSGDRNLTVNNISTPEQMEEQSLVFISKPEHIAHCFSKKPKVVISPPQLLNLFNMPVSFTLLTAENFKSALNAVLPLFDDKHEKFNYQIHPSAIISTNVILGKNVKIGPFSYIGENVTIGDNTIVGPNCVIERKATIGNSSILHASIYLGSHCEIGSHCEVHPHTSIGSDGFGYYTDQNYHHHKIPQIGKVVIEDRVEIGSNCCFDRATITETRIKKGSKIDNLCHFAHNCSLGENSLIAAGFFVAGSTHLGHRFTTGGNSVVSTHLNICDGVTLAGRSTVTNDVVEAGQYGGYPLQKIKDALKTISSLTKLVEMRKQLSKIIATLNIKE